MEATETAEAGGVVGVGVLGSLEVIVGSQRVAVTAPKERALLCLLTLHAGQVVGAAELIGGLWGEDPPRSALKTLQTYVSGLRRVLPVGAVQTTSGGYVLAVSPERVDATRFEGLIRSARERLESGDLEEAVELLVEGLRLWRGPALMGTPDSPVLAAAAQRLEEVRRAAVEDLNDLRLELGRHTEAIADLEAAVASEPLRERRWAQLMLALYRCGRQADALRAYRRLSGVLGEELGIGPSAELAALEQAILLQQPSLAWLDRPHRDLPGPAGPGDTPEPDEDFNRRGDFRVDRGPVTLLLADFEDGDEAWERDPGSARAAGERLRAALAEAVGAADSRLLPSVGSQFRAVFVSARAAVAAAVALRHQLVISAPADAAQPDCRLGLHTGVCEERFGDLVGSTVARVSQLQVAAHAGQIVMSAITADIVADHLPAGVALRDLGQHRFHGLERPEHIFQVDIDGLPHEFPPLRSLSPPGRRHNLPIQPTGFVGRHRELEDVADLLGAGRLVTCSGPGGIGKTRLALQAAAGLLDRSGDGVWLVELAGVTDPAFVPGAVAEAIGVRDEPGRPLLDYLADVLRDRTMLIVLDNCEHLIEACATLAQTLLRTCAHLQVLATSREPLGLDGEYVFRVPSLSLPAPGDVVAAERLCDYEAVRLFVERAVAHHPGFVLDDSAAPSVVSICRRLDGIPLAIELAAARIRSLSLPDIESRLEDRFRLLTGGQRTALPRQQTLRALIDWSYDLLSEPERTVLRRLAVFVGGFDLSTAETVVADPLLSDTDRNPDLNIDDVVDLVTSLADKSLIQVEPSAQTVRYRLMETIRQYALVRLRETTAHQADNVAAAHAQVFVRLAELAGVEMEGPHQMDWLRRIDADHDNLRAAFAYLHRETLSADTPEAAAARADDALRLASSLRRYWESRAFYREGVEMLEAAIGHPGAQAGTSRRASALASLGNLQLFWGDRDAGHERVGDALVIARAHDDTALTASCLVTRSYLCTFGGQPAEALRAADEAVGLALQCGSDIGSAQALRARYLCFLYQGDMNEARRDIDHALSLARQARNPIELVAALNNRACLESDLGEFATAQMFADEAHGTATDMGIDALLPYTFTTLATLSLRRGRPEAAQKLALDALVVVARTFDRVELRNAVLLLALSVSATGQPEWAAFLHGAADAFLIEGTTDDPVEARLRDDDRATLRRLLGDTGFDVAYGRGRLCSSVDELFAYLRERQLTSA